MLLEALRYLGIQGEADSETLRLVSDCMEKLKSVAAPKSIVRQFSPAEFAPFLVGECIKNFLAETEEITVFAATLGIGVDVAIKKEQAVDMARAAAMDACAAAYIESYCDSLMPYGLDATNRFSPGYGDFPLFLQPALLKSVSAHKIGISALESYMLLPTKSITAVVGGRRKCIGDCMRCERKACIYRKEAYDEAEL